MKTLISLTLSFLFMSLAHAADLGPIEGTEASGLFDALYKAGASIDCGAGSCGTSATDVTCSRVKSRKQSAECSLAVQNTSGLFTAKRLQGKRAERLIEAMINAGLASCGMESCDGGVETIDCIRRNEPTTNQTESSPDSCQIVPTLSR